MRLGEVDENMRSGESRLQVLLAKHRAEMIDDIVSRHEAGKISPRNLKSQAASSPKNRVRGERELVGVLREIAESGKADVLGEVKRQVDKDVALADEDRDDSLEEELLILAALLLLRNWEQIRTAGLDAWVRATAQFPPGTAGNVENIADVMRGELSELSERQLRDLARSGSTESYNDGRKAEIESDAKIQFVVRSEILDNGTCGPCVRLDSTVYRVGTAEYYKFRPPAYCNGRSRCRGVFFPIRTDARLLNAA